ncbi:MAG: BrnA antitoxin family protein [Acidobacteriota bacterium]
MKTKKRADEVHIDVTEEEYQAMRAKGIDEDALLEPGRHTFVRGLFKKMHPDYSPQTSKVRISIYIDADVLAYFRKRAAQPNAAPYQTQINNELRAVMELEAIAAPSAKRSVKASPAAKDYSTLIDDPQFIAAVAERVRQQPQVRKRGQKAA